LVVSFGVSLFAHIENAPPQKKIPLSTMDIYIHGLISPIQGLKLRVLHSILLRGWGPINLPQTTLEFWATNVMQLDYCHRVVSHQFWRITPWGICGLFVKAVVIYGWLWEPQKILIRSTYLLSQITSSQRIFIWKQISFVEEGCVYFV